MSISSTPEQATAEAPPDVVSTASAEEPLTGRRLGRWRVGPVVHDGPMSTLYRAHDVILDRPVALKVISRALAGDEEFRARFVEEARTLSAVDHPHVVPLYDHDEIDGQLFLAMRWVDGSTIRDLTAGRPMPLATTLELFSQVASALDAVHARGLVHLDVKPANILVCRSEPDPRGGRHGAGHVYLGDFGLTRRGRTAGVTAAGQFVGSPSFAAPEHLRGDPVTAATDVYGLACALYLAVTGRAPYDGSVNEVIHGHLAGQYGAPSGLWRAARTAPELGLAVGPATDAELERAMAQDPSRRPPTATALIAAVHRAMSTDARGPARPHGPGGHPYRSSPDGQGPLGVLGQRTRPPTAPTVGDPFAARARQVPQRPLADLVQAMPLTGRLMLAALAVLILLVVLATALGAS